MSKHCTIQTSNPEDMIYDLYGVVNHMGSLREGHYVAQCYNEAKDKWYNYDDNQAVETFKGMKKTNIAELKYKIATSSAYILFYKSRG